MKLDADDDHKMRTLNLLKNPPWGDDDDKNVVEDYKRRTRIDSYIYKGCIYSIVRVYLRRLVKNSITKSRSELKTQMFLVILKHNPDTDEAEKIMEEPLFDLNQEHDWTMAMRPYFIHNDIMYFACFHNDFEK